MISEEVAGLGVAAAPRALSLPPLHQQVFFNVVDENVKLPHRLVDAVLVHLQVEVGGF